MNNITVLRNKIQENLIEVYAVHPETYRMLKSKIKELPQNTIFYPNEFCPVGELQQADLQDASLEKFIFEEVLPRCEFIKGECPDLNRKL